MDSLTSTNLFLFALFIGVNCHRGWMAKWLRKGTVYIYIHLDVCKVTGKMKSIDGKKGDDDVHDVITQIFYANELIFVDFDQTQCQSLIISFQANKAPILREKRMNKNRLLRSFMEHVIFNFQFSFYNEIYLQSRFIF